MTEENTMTGKSGYLMPYGKHRGRDVAEVPLPYLRWFLKNGKAPAPVLDAIALRAAPALLKSLDRELARPAGGLSPLEGKFRELTQKLAVRLREAQRDGEGEGVQ